MEIVKPREVQRLFGEYVVKNVHEVNIIIELGKKILAHRCNPRCQVMVG